MATIALAQYAFQDLSIDGTTLKGCTGQGIQYNHSVTGPAAGSQLYPTRHQVQRSSPGARFTALAGHQLIADILTDLQAAVPHRTFDAAGMVMRGAKNQNETIGLATASGETRTAADGVCWLRRVRITPSAPAEFECEALFISSDGDASPIAEATGTVPAEPVDAGELLFLKSVTIDGDEWEGVTSVDIEQMVMAQAVVAVGARYPQRVYLAGANGPVEQRITVRHRHADQAVLSELKDTTVVVRLEEITDAGAQGTKWVQCSGRGLLVPENTLEGRQGSPIESGLTLRCNHDGSSTTPLTWTWYTP